jgi:hypothetical protein
LSETGIYEIDERPPLEAVFVRQGHPARDNFDEFYKAGFADVTKVEFGHTAGQHAHLLTVKVWKGDDLFAEFPFMNVVGVYYEPKAEAKTFKCDACRDGANLDALDNDFICAVCGERWLPF